jgi:hypothetical protein
LASITVFTGILRLLKQSMIENAEQIHPPFVVMCRYISGGGLDGEHTASIRNLISSVRKYLQSENADFAVISAQK